MKQIALNIIEREFADKKDKAGEPYIGHLKRVAENAKNYFDGSEDLKELEIIALLHDLLEDCDGWSAGILQAIFTKINISMTIDKLARNIGEPYQDYIEKLKHDRFARAVKLADLKDNMDLTRLTELTEKDIERTKKYHKAYRYLLEINNNSNSSN